MENTLKELKAVHSSKLIIILVGENIRIYDEDACIVEFLSNLISKNDVLIFKYKYLDKITSILKRYKIDYVILDNDNNYYLCDYYYTSKNKYNFYLKISKRFNKFRRIIIYIYNYIFGIPLNRYK